MDRRLRVAVDVDRSGVVYAFLFGGVVGALLAYPALPTGAQVLDPSALRFEAGPVAGPLIGGVALFLLFVLGVFALNWLFIEASEP
jgi:hypothetical protein